MNASKLSVNSIKHKVFLSCTNYWTNSRKSVPLERIRNTGLETSYIDVFHLVIFCLRFLFLKSMGMGIHTGMYTLHIKVVEDEQEIADNIYAKDSEYDF